MPADLFAIQGLEKRLNCLYTLGVGAAGWELELPTGRNRHYPGIYSQLGAKRNQSLMNRFILLVCPDVHAPYELLTGMVHGISFVEYPRLLPFNGIAELLDEFFGSNRL